jgi:hypothetical protein
MKRKLTLVRKDTDNKGPKITRDFLDERGIPYINVPRKLIYLRHFFKMPVSTQALGLILYKESLESSDFPTFELKQIPLKGFSKYQTIFSLKRLVELEVLYLHKVKGLNDHYTWNFEYLLNFSDEEILKLKETGLGYLFEEPEKP